MNRGALFFAYVICCGSANATLISTYESWTGNGDRNGSSTQAGQTFRCPNSTEVLLTYWEHKVKNLGGVAMNLTATLYEWGSTNVSGAAMRTSSVSLSTGTAFQDVRFSLGAVLDPLKTYAIFIKSSGPDMGNATGDPVYGQGIYLVDIDGPAGPIAPIQRSYLDMCFRAQFTAVPEPASLAVAMLGSLGLLSRRRNTR